MEKSEKITEFNSYKASNQELNVILEYKLNKRSTGEISQREVIENFKSQVQPLLEDISFNLEVPKIGAKYRATGKPYSNVGDGDIYLINKNSYTFNNLRAIGYIMSGRVMVKHRLTLQNLDKKFELIKEGDLFSINTNKLNIDSDSNVIIQLNNGITYYCKVDNSSPILRTFSAFRTIALKVIKIKNTRR